MRPDDLLATARLLALADEQGPPRQSNLRRAASTAYYALFHCLARCVADSFVGGSRAGRDEIAWWQAYRSLEHSQAKRKCRNTESIGKFPEEIQNFANIFCNMQEKRHEADYDPKAKLYRDWVLNDIRLVESVIDEFVRVPLKDRRAFAVYIVLKHRR